MKSVTAILFILFVLTTFAAFGYSTLKNKQHLQLCDAFRDKFGFLPGGITIAQAGGMFLTFQKDFYFIFPFAFKKGSFPVRNMNPDHYDFIRTLPKEHTSWLKVKFTLFLITILLFFATIITSFLFE